MDGFQNHAKSFPYTQTQTHLRKRMVTRFDLVEGGRGADPPGAT